MEMTLCRYCFKSVKALDKHQARCKVEQSVPTVAELTRVVRHLLERVDAQDRTIQHLKRSKCSVDVALRETPVLTPADLDIFLTDGIDVLLMEREWPLHTQDGILYTCTAGEWVPATDEDVKAQAVHVLAQLARLFSDFVEHKGWRLNDPKGLYPECSAKVYGVRVPAVQRALCLRSKS